MSIVQWLLLILVIAVVAGAYWYLRRQSESDPWQGMDDETADQEGAEARGEALGGDSYIVGVRTLSSSTPASRKAANGQGRSASESAPEPELPEETAEASWQAYKSAPPEAPADSESGLEADAGDPPATEASAAPEPAPAAPAPPDSERVENMRPQRAPDGEQQIFQLHVASPDGRAFEGPAIHAALKAQDLKFGLNDIYHRVTEANGVPESVFAVANMLKPGTLDPAERDQLATPGLTLFLVLPGPVEGVQAMRDMMETANGLAKALGGDVLDDKRALLKAQTAQYMLDQIADLDRRARIAQRR